MKVSLILKKKGLHEVATIAQSSPVSDAVVMLAERKIGALVVADAPGRIDGILSERDIVASLGSRGPEILHQTVAELMTSSVESCVGDDTAFNVLERMTSGRFRHMPVLGANGLMLGILSIGDVVKARLEEIESENAAMADMLGS